VRFFDQSIWEVRGHLWSLGFCMVRWKKSGGGRI